MSINVLLTLVEQYKEAAQLIEAAQAMGLDNKDIIFQSVSEREYCQVLPAVQLLPLSV